MTRVLQSLGIQVLDADKLGHKTYEPGSECQRKLMQNFGKNIVGEDGQVNRPLLGSIVFSDPAKMKELQGIVWPEIRILLAENLHRLEQEGCKVVVLEAAVMIEAGWQNMVSTLWVINVDRDVAKERLMKRNGLSEKDACSRIDSQLSNEERGRHANLLFSNSSDAKSLEEFEQEVLEAYNAIYVEDSV